MFGSSDVASVPAAAKEVESVVGVKVEEALGTAAGKLADVAEEDDPARRSRVVAPVVVVVVVAVVGCGKGGTIPESKKFWEPLVSWLVRKLDRLPLDMGTGGAMRLDNGAMGPPPTICDE